MQTYKVFVSNLAKSDLKNITAYLSMVESTKRAQLVEQGILSELKRLSHFPEAFPKDEYASTNRHIVRFIIKWHYKILYFIDSETVEVIGIFHTAQNPKKLTHL
jgi:toxin ParE1/3/4